MKSIDKPTIIFLIITVPLALGLFFVFLFSPKTIIENTGDLALVSSVELSPTATATPASGAVILSVAGPTSSPDAPPSSAPFSGETSLGQTSGYNISNDIMNTDSSTAPRDSYPNPNQLANPPGLIKAIYLTGASAGSPGKINYLIDLAKTTEINAVVIDIKDFSGYVFYDAKIPELENYKAKNIRIPNIDKLLKKLHEQGIYIIARIVVFQDPVLAKARPELAVQSLSKTAALSEESSASEPAFALWLDKNNLAWIDPAAKYAWHYNAAIAKDALSRGFDEVNFDYIRFPSDGDLEDIVFPFWDGRTYRHAVLAEFFKYLREELGSAKLSVDLFGYSATNFDDLGVGQVIEDAFGIFDFISPMLYPSHYSKGFLEFPNPAEHPFEVVKKSMGSALARLSAFNTRASAIASPPLSDGLELGTVTARQSKLRPWLQDFDLGTEYTPEMVKSEIDAVAATSGSDSSGFMLWNAGNIYTKAALDPEEQMPATRGQ